MTRDHSRAQRFARIWLGPSLATLVGIGSTVELAAMPMPAPGAQLLGPTLIQQPAGRDGDAQLPAGTARPPSAGEGMSDSLIKLQESLTAARERLEALSKAAVAVAASRQQELVALREENQQLRANIEATQAERGELEAAKQAAAVHAAEVIKQRSRIEELEGSAAQESAETARLREQLKASERRIAAVDSAGAESEARLGETRNTLQRAQQEKARVGADLAKVQEELATAKKQVAAAAQERAQLEQRAAVVEDERDDLRTRLADATARLRSSESEKAQLESEVAKLHEAAGTAAADARQSLIAVENRIKDLNEAIAAIGPTPGPLATAGSVTPSAGEQAGHEQHTGAAPVQHAGAGAAPTQGAKSGSTDADLQRIKTASATGPGEGEGAHLDQRGILGGVPAVLSLADLPLEKRQHVQGLLADLHSRMDERGLITTVPGELLFVAGSDEVQAGAHDTLVKVADLISMYGDRQVLIIGHTDADGDAADNQRLSERRAETVKQYFVNDFALAPDRLSTEGLGEARPIASNATPEGRRANRRVEVLILN